MAICDQVPGLNIAIVVNEGPLAEYALPSDVTKPNERTDYIEPKGGSKFSIKLAFTASLFRQRRSNLCCEIYLDGQFVTCVWIYKEELIEDHERNVGSATYNEEGGRVERDFTFTDVVTVDETESGHLGVDFDAQKLGILTIKCRRFHIIENARKPKKSEDNIDSVESQKGEKTEKTKKGKESKKRKKSDEGEPQRVRALDAIPERKLKHLTVPPSCQTTLGEARPAAALRPSISTSTSTMRFVIHEGSFATFSFKCCSRFSLQCMGLIPRSPSPDPVLILKPDPYCSDVVKQEVSVEGMTRGELEAFVHQLMAMRGPKAEATKQLKRKLPKDEAVFQSQPLSKRYRSEFDATVGREVIDLDDDLDQQPAVQYRGTFDVTAGRDVVDLDD